MTRLEELEKILETVCEQYEEYSYIYNKNEK